VQAGVASDPGTTSGITTVALEDHVHNVDTTGTPGTVGATSAQGTGTGLARTNHTHRLGLLTAKGDLIGFNGTNPVVVTVGANGLVLMADSTAASGWSWKEVGATYMWAAINCTGAGDTTVIAGVAGKKLRVAGIVFSCSAAVDIAFKSAANVLIAAMSFDATGGMGDYRGPDGWFCETNASEAFIMNLSGASNVRGSVVYEEV
jgi:hypothetical protein